MIIYVWSFLIGVVTGLRSMTAPAAVSWAARMGWLHLENTRLAFLGYAATPYIITVLALLELVTDKLPRTPNRTAPQSFAIRVAVGALCGAALGASQSLLIGLAAGVAGAVVGTLGGFILRRGIVFKTGGNDFPVAISEDVIAIASAILIVSRFA